VFSKFAYNGYNNYTKKGFENQFKKWKDEAVLTEKYDLKGKNILITGASSGLGNKKQVFPSNIFLVINR
jgi:hypothetical protein